MKWKILILLSAVTLISLLVAEILIRVALPRPGFLPPDVSGLLTPHPIRHYTYTPGFVGKITQGEYQIDIAINSMGLRDDEIRSDEKVDILAAGNSFTVGFGVQAEESWPSQLESYVNAAVFPSAIRVVNAGVSGYSMKQIRLHIEELLYLEPRIIVLGLYPSRYWRIGNPYIYINGRTVLSNRAPHFRATDGGFLFSPFNKGLRQVHFWLMKNFHIAAYLLEVARKLEMRLTRSNPPTASLTLIAEDRLSPLLDELGEIERLLRDRGIDLVVLLVNHQEKNGSFSPLDKEYNAIVKSYCKNSGITVFDPVPYFESSSLGGSGFRIGKDHHWSKRAHALVGKLLGDFLLQHSLIQRS